jgi:protease-4
MALANERGSTTRARRIALAVVSLCAVVTLVGAAIGLSRGGTEEGSSGFARGKAGVAVIKLDGAITDAMVAPKRGGRETVYAQLRRAERDRSVKAVVLRVNSPGGSAAASNALYEEVRRLRQAGKPVVAYFTDVAASGGYYVGAAGDRIVAQPASVTGSIGVLLTWYDLRGLQDKVGVQERVIKSGPYKDILSASRDLAPEERAILEKLIQDSLDQFVKAVAEGRKLPEAEVRRIADGRIFSGSEALRLRLVDEVGDEYRAIQLAAELAGLEGEIRIILYEQPRSAWSALLEGSLPGGEALETLVPEGGISVRYEWR